MRAIVISSSERRRAPENENITAILAQDRHRSHGGYRASRRLSTGQKKQMRGRSARVQRPTHLN
jgi:hypothetical protein